jgi:hypothetical protein
MLIFIATPLQVVACVMTLVCVGACVGYIVRDVQTPEGTS